MQLFIRSLGEERSDCKEEVAIQPHVPGGGTTIKGVIHGRGGGTRWLS